MDHSDPAFPCGIQPHDYQQQGMPFFNGMSQRDWFAGMALISSYAACKMGGEADSAIAGSCYAMADAMLDARHNETLSPAV